MILLKDKSFESLFLLFFFIILSIFGYIKFLVPNDLYIPKKPGFSCPKGIHYDHDDFIRVFSASFQKNNAFSFCRSDKSFHGVEKVQEKSVERKLLQYSLYGNLK